MRFITIFQCGGPMRCTAYRAATSIRA